jgi:hypothetical protein
MMEWISVKDKLPEYPQVVLVTNKDSNLYSTAYFNGTQWIPDPFVIGYDSWDDFTALRLMIEPTHWMPLPEPPKEE